MKYVAITIAAIFAVPSLAVLCIMIAATYYGAVATMLSGSWWLGAEIFFAATMLCALQEIMTYRCLQGSPWEKRYLPNTAIIAAVRRGDGTRVDTHGGQIFLNSLLSIAVQYAIGSALLFILAHLHG